MICVTVMQSSWVMWYMNVSFVFNGTPFFWDERGPPSREARGLVFLRKENRRGRPVSLRDDPELSAVAGIVGGYDPCAVCQSPVVGGAVVFCEVSPVSRLMALYPFEDVILCKGIPRFWRSENPAETENGYGGCMCAHSPKSSRVAARLSSSSPRISTSPAFNA